MRISRVGTLRSGSVASSGRPAGRIIRRITGLEFPARSRLPAALAGLAATAFLGAPALAHHSQAMFDTSKEVLIRWTVTRLEWKNPHIVLIVETVGADGKRQLVQGEGLATTQALVDGLHPADLPPGSPVVVRANPNRFGPGKTVRLLDVTTPDGEIHPFYAASARTRTLVP